MQTNQDRHTFGFVDKAYRRPEKLLTFFHLLSEFFPVRTTHNRQVEGSSPSGPTILLFFIGFL